MVDDWIDHGTGYRMSRSSEGGSRFVCPSYDVHMYEEEDNGMRKRTDIEKAAELTKSLSL